MRLSSSRPLVLALVVSLLIHAVILLRVAGVSPLQVDAPAATINVVVRPVSPETPPMPPSAVATRPAAAPVKSIAPVVRRATAPQIVVPESPSSLATAAPPETHDAGQHAPAPPTAAGEGGSPATVAKPGPAREGVSADDLRQYRLSLATATKRFKRYPALARERGWEGSVDVALTGNPALPEPEIMLVRSSGRALLDDQALAMLAQAARSTTVPDGMRGRSFRVQLTIEFNLENDQ